jgi:hypothetical protein
MSTYVSIGRNIGAEPMSPTDWRLFRRSVDATVSAFAGPIVTRAEGLGEYDGATEPTYIVVGAANPDGPVAWSMFGDELREIAAQFGQESIAVTVGTPTFVGPSGEDG